MDIQKLINDKTEEVLQSGTVEKLIQDNVEKSIHSAIESKFGGYTFKREIEDKLSNIIDPALKEVSLENYSSVVVGRIGEIIRGYLDKNLVEKVEKSYKDLFEGDKDPIKLSTFLDDVRDYYKDEDGESYDEYFSLDFTRKEDGNFTWWTIRFDEESDKGDYSNWDYEIKFLEYNNTGSTEGDKLSSIKTPNLKYSSDTSGVLLKADRLSGLERTLLNAFFSNRIFILDVDNSGDIDTSKFDEQ